MKNNFQESDTYEKMQFYYHPDHLGSSSYITNLDGEVAQHIEYVPFGEVFVEERNNTWNTPYLFNAKEFDEETGMYYYGARYYEPRLSLWMSVDPLKEKARDVSPYVYCNQNPIIMFDPDGKKAWIVIWATQSSDATGRTRIGHTGVVVENYKLNVNTNGINKSGVGSIREESITDWRGILVNLNPFHKSFTPNSTYNQLQNNPNTVVVKSAGNKTKESYEDAIIDR